MESHSRGYHPRKAGFDREHAKHDNFSRFGRLVNLLKAVDPKWEEWYDDNTNIPETIYWANAGPLLERLEARIIFVQTKACE